MQARFRLPKIEVTIGVSMIRPSRRGLVLFEFVDTLPTGCGVRSKASRFVVSAVFISLLGAGCATPTKSAANSQPPVPTNNYVQSVDAGLPAASSTQHDVQRPDAAAPAPSLVDHDAGVAAVPSGAPRITIDRSAPNVAAPFLIQWEGLPAVSRDGKSIAVVLDAGLIHQDTVFLVLDGASGATKRAIPLVSGRAAKIYRQGDVEYDGVVAAAVIASTEESVKEAHRILQHGGYASLPRLELSLEPLTRAVDAARTAGPDAGAPRMPAQSASVGATTVILDNDRLTVDHAGQLTERRVPQWRHAEYSTPEHVHCAFHAALGEVAVDEPRGRVVLLVHQYLVNSGDLCAEPSRYYVIALKPAH